MKKITLGFGDELIREIEFSQYICRGICVEAAVIINSGNVLLRIFVYYSQKKEQVYDITFNIDWLEGRNERIDWLAVVLSNQLRDNIERAQNNITSELRSSFQNINNILKIFP